MGESSNRRHIILWSLYCALTAAVGFLYLLPLNFSGPSWAAPDLIIGLTYVWTLRRPHDLPILLIAVVIFMADLLFQRPLGLMTAIVVVGCEFLRSRAPFMRDTPFVVEWFVIGVVIFVSFLTNRLLLTLVMVPKAALTTELLHVMVTILSYPLIILLFRWVQRFGYGHQQVDGWGRSS